MIVALLCLTSVTTYLARSITTAKRNSVLIIIHPHLLQKPSWPTPKITYAVVGTSRRQASKPSLMRRRDCHEYVTEWQVRGASDLHPRRSRFFFSRLALGYGFHGSFSRGVERSPIACIIFHCPVKKNREAGPSSGRMSLLRFMKGPRNLRAWRNFVMRIFFLVLFFLIVWIFSLSWSWRSVMSVRRKEKTANKQALEAAPKDSELSPESICSRHHKCGVSRKMTFCPLLAFLTSVKRTTSIRFRSTGGGWSCCALGARVRCLWGRVY
ncbi:hypothetical protein BKA64DRAFT_165582 [Cadophora sp. MPI-SDFR-AT-0126]|nr:hypothetical protein BKA64DRAFT_165582 [Leotiomycetes sp. MPI-SDFR-AT-0126]